jgi:hypothetical protein
MTRSPLIPLVVAGAFLFAARADAATQRCHTNPPKVIKIPKGADVRVTEQTCVIEFPEDARRAKYKAWVYTTWRPVGGGGVRPKQFEDYDVTARLELNQRGKDRVLTTRTCRIASRLNALVSGSYTCQTPVDGVYGRFGRFSGDGRVIYDIDGDGKNNFRWPLHGSPTV